MLEAYWSRAFSHVVEVALSLCNHSLKALFTGKRGWTCFISYSLVQYLLQLGTKLLNKHPNSSEFTKPLKNLDPPISTTTSSYPVCNLVVAPEVVGFYECFARGFGFDWRSITPFAKSASNSNIRVVNIT